MANSSNVKKAYLRSLRRGDIIPYVGLTENASWHQHMRADIRLLTYCHEIYMLAGWERSTGASAEHALAMYQPGAITFHTEPEGCPDSHDVLIATCRAVVKK